MPVSQRSRQHRATHSSRKREQPRLLPALPAILNDNQVLTFKQWTALNGISARTGRRILKAPGGTIVGGNNRARRRHERHMSRLWRAV